MTKEKIHFEIATPATMFHNIMCAIRDEREMLEREDKKDHKITIVLGENEMNAVKMHANTYVSFRYRNIAAPPKVQILGHDVIHCPAMNGFQILVGDIYK